MRHYEWQPIVGCSFASAGCANCAALAHADADLKRRGTWSGATRLRPEALGEPEALAEPCAVFVANHGDLFHENTVDAWIDDVFAVMEREPRHAYQVLTKRAARMRAYVTRRYGPAGAPPQIALGVSVERQAEADARLPELSATPAPLKYVTLYPLLEPVRLGAHLRGLAMVSAGEERQRPARPEWFEAARAECAAAGVPFLRGNLIGEAA